MRSLRAAATRPIFPPVAASQLIEVPDGRTTPVSRDCFNCGPAAQSRAVLADLHPVGFLIRLSRFRGQNHPRAEVFRLGEPVYVTYLSDKHGRVDRADSVELFNDL